MRVTSGVNSHLRVSANVSNVVSLSVYWSLLGFCGTWCCMRLDLLLGFARGFPGSSCISPVQCGRNNILSLSLSHMRPGRSEAERAAAVGG